MTMMADAIFPPFGLDSACRVESNLSMMGNDCSPGSPLSVGPSTSSRSWSSQRSSGSSSSMDLLGPSMASDVRYRTCLGGLDKGDSSDMPPLSLAELSALNSAVQMNQMQCLLQSMALGQVPIMPGSGGTMATGSGGPEIEPRRRKRPKRNRSKNVDGAEPKQPQLLKKTGKVLCSAVITPVSGAVLEERARKNAVAEQRKDPTDGKLKSRDDFLMDHACGVDFSRGEELWKQVGGTEDFADDDVFEAELPPDLLDGSDSEEELVLNC